MTYTIRPANADDLPQIVALSIAAYHEFADILAPEQWEQMRAGMERLPQVAATGICFVAEDGSRILGSVVYVLPGKSDARLFPPEWATIRLLAVDPSARGQGIGRRLTDMCIAQARQDGATIIGLHTSDMMATARAMYERMGFQQDGELPRFFGRTYWRYRLLL